MHERINASFQLRAYAIAKAEKNVPREFNEKAIYNQLVESEENLVRYAILNKIDVVRQSIGNFSSSNMIEECDILTKYCSEVVTSCQKIEQKIDITFEYGE